MANEYEQRIINAAVAVANEYLYISRDGENLKGPWTWLDKGPSDPMVELCFAIQEAVGRKDVLLKGMSPSDGIIIKCSVCGNDFGPDHICLPQQKQK